MHIFVDQTKLLKGNADITDEAQQLLHAQLREQELRRMFPDYFNTPLSIPAHQVSASAEA